MQQGKKVANAAILFIMRHLRLPGTISWKKPPLLIVTICTRINILVIFQPMEQMEELELKKKDIPGWLMEKILEWDIQQKNKL
jgi:uncharacterized Fe-S radical SAM superfamily protein PflX